MTGNTVHLGNSLGSREWSNAIWAVVVLTAFVSGSLAGRILIEIGARKRLRRIASWALGIETAMLLIVAAVLPAASADGGPVPYPKVALAMLAGSMGLQTATITRVGALTVHTTFVTGMINKLCQLLSHVLFDTYDIARRRLPAAHAYGKHRADAFRAARFIFSVWILYLAGAVAGTWLQRIWQLTALYLPAAVMCVAIAADQRSPLSIEEERDQAER